MNKTDAIIVATDGSSLGNPGEGGWGWYVDSKHWSGGAEPNATNNRMELYAIWAVLDQLPSERALHIISDSQYSINAVTKWVHGWRRNGWVSKAGKNVANKELIQALMELLESREGRVTFEHVRGHQGHVLNEAVDAVARNASEALKAKNSIPIGPGWNGTTPGIPKVTKTVDAAVSAFEGPPDSVYDAFIPPEELDWGPSTSPQRNRAQSNKATSVRSQGVTRHKQQPSVELSEPDLAERDTLF